MSSAYEHALRLARAGRIVACIPGTDEDGSPYVQIPEFEPSPIGAMAAFHPDAKTRELFICGVTVGLGRYCETDRDFALPIARLGDDA